MNLPAAVVFDMDGLIFNSEDLYDVAFAQLLKRRNLEFSLETKLQMMGHRADVAFKILKQKMNLSEPVEELQQELETLFEACVELNLETMPGFDDLFAAVIQASYPIAVATSSHRHMAIKMLGQVDLLKHLQFVLCGDDVQHGKPDPEIYLKAAQKLGIASERMLVLEDSLAGTKAGVAAGSITVAVPNRHTQDCDFRHVYFVANTLADPRLWELLQLKNVPS